MQQKYAAIYENLQCALQAGIHSTNKKKPTTNQGVVLIIAPRNKNKALKKAPR